MIDSRPSADAAEAATEQEAPATEHETPGHVELTCEVDISAMKEEKEEYVEIATEEEEKDVEEDDFGEPTLHCGECNFKTRSGDALGGDSTEKSLA